MGQNGLLLPLSAFTVWMLASFLCHKLAKMAMRLYEDAMTPFSFQIVPLVMTFIQVLCCYATTKVASRNNGTLLFYVTAASHVLATLATNISLALTFASSTLAVKMLEPVTSAVLQSWLLKTPVGADSAAGMVIAVAGAILYVGNPIDDSNAARAVVMAVLSNLTLGVRNVAMKHVHNHSSSSSSTSQLTPNSNIVGFFLGANVAILAMGWWMKAATEDGLHSNLVHFLLLSLASGTCHVIYSYVSMNVVLRHLSVVSHGLANILKRVLVVLLLHVSGRRTATLWNWAGLGVCVVGMLVYNLKKIFPSARSQTPLTPASEIHDVDRRTEEQVESGSGSHDVTRIKEKHLLRLLLPIAIIFVLCTMPKHITVVNPLKYVQPACNVSELRSLNEIRENSPQSVLHSVCRQNDQTMLSSHVLKSNPRHEGNSDTDYALNLRFGYVNWTDGKPLIAGPISFQPNRKSCQEIDEFLSREHLTETPFDTDGLSPYLTTAREVINENKRVHLNLFRDLLRGKKYAVLFELASFENKGDAAITMGELIFLENLGVQLLTYVDLHKCRKNRIQKAIEVAKKYPKDEVVMLFHGGGNLIAKSVVDGCRQHSLRLSRGYQQVMFPNSFWLRDSRFKFENSRRLFCCNSNMTVLLRDKLSLHIAQRIFNGGTRLILSPDIALQVGYVGRYVAPYYDIIWQKRVDKENAIFGQIPSFPSNVSVFVWDWMKMFSIPSEHSVRKAMNVVQNGFGILQQGKVLVTDRLHGHILSMLLDIPHVLLDNADQKLSSFHNTWTRGVKNCRLTDNAEDAARLALELLEEYKDTVPKRLNAAHLEEPS